MLLEYLVYLWEYISSVDAQSISGKGKNVKNLPENQALNG
jgi:hypothetical protein